MHYNKRNMKLSAAVLASVGMLCMTCYDTSAAEAPTDIHLTVETKEIAIEDVPADRIVALNIYQENCPYFDVLVFPMKKDPRLSYFPDDECFSIADGVMNARRPGIRYNDSDPDCRACEICSSIGDDLFVEFGSAVATVTFMLPEQLSPGDFFSVDLLRSDSDLQIRLGKSRADIFKDSCFTQLNSGGIRIIKKEQPAPSGGNGGGSSQGGNAQGNGEVQGSGGDTQAGAEPQNGGDNAPQENTAAVTSTVITGTAAVSAASQTTSTTSKSTTTKSTSTGPSQSTTADIPTGAPQGPEKKKTNGLLIIGIFTLIAAAVSSMTILASKLRINKKG